MRGGKTTSMADQVVEALRAGESVVVVHGDPRRAADVDTWRPILEAVEASELVAARRTRYELRTENGGWLRVLYADTDRQLQGIRPDRLIEGSPPIGGTAWYEFNHIRQMLEARR